MRITREEAEGLGSRRRGDEVRQSPAGTRRVGGATPKEKDIQRAILEFLKTVPGVVAWKTGGGMFRLSYKGKERMVRMGRAGVGDIIGWRRRWVTGAHANGPAQWQWNAQFLAIEVKRPGRYLTAEQDAFMASVTRAGGLAILAHSVEDVAKGLQ